MSIGRESVTARISELVSATIGSAAPEGKFDRPPTHSHSCETTRHTLSLPSEWLELAAASSLRSVLSEFTSAWECGLTPSVDTYLNRLDPADFRGAIELIYREYCLAEAAGQQPSASQYLRRFPRHSAALGRLLGLHHACSLSVLRHCGTSMPSSGNIPMPGSRLDHFFCVVNLDVAVSHGFSWLSRSTWRTVLSSSRLRNARRPSLGCLLECGIRTSRISCPIR